MRQPSISSTEIPGHGKIISVYVLAYLYWFASTILAGLATYAGREAMMSLIILASLPPGGKPSESDMFYINLQARAIDGSLFIIYGAMLILAIVSFESMFRHWAFYDDLEMRFFKIIAYESALITLLALVAWLVETGMNGFTWRSLHEPLLSILWTAFITWQWRAFHNTPTTTG